MGDARRTQSSFFARKRNTEEALDKESVTNERQKRTRELLEVPTITVGDDAVSHNTTLTTTNTTYQGDAVNRDNRDAIKLERLVDKIDRYNSHNEFITRCISNNVIPNSYKVLLEPSIGNHDDTFLKGYYELMSNCSIQLMKYTAEYCTRKASEFNEQQITADNNLKTTTTTETYTELKKTILINHEKRKKNLKEIKDKKFIRLKYKTTQTQNQPTNGDQRTRERNIPTNYNNKQPPNRLPRRETSKTTTYGNYKPAKRNSNTSHSNVPTTNNY